MKKVDVLQVLISLSAIFGISLVWYDFNVKVFHTVRDLLSAILYDEFTDENINEFYFEVLFFLSYQLYHVRQQAHQDYH